MVHEIHKMPDNHADTADKYQIAVKIEKNIHQNTAQNERYRNDEHY